jgi:mannose-6-phosphate isomerase-like protein (cupin superfamily)
MIQEINNLMNTALIEIYYTKENGYHPFFIREHWQVAQLNYLPALSFTSIERLDLHQKTDEIFVLTRGKAVLIAAAIDNDLVRFECNLMEPGVTYNIPINTWHNIAMDESAEIMIIEKSNTHLGDCLYFQLTETDKCRLKDLILQLVNHSN